MLKLRIKLKTDWNVCKCSKILFFEEIKQLKKNNSFYLNSIFMGVCVHMYVYVHVPQCTNGH